MQGNLGAVGGGVTRVGMRATFTRRRGWAPVCYKLRATKKHGYLGYDASVADRDR